MKPEIYDNPFRWLFRSESRPEISHLVDLCEGPAGVCTCEDWQIRQQPIGGRCKHILAAREHLLDLIIQREKERYAEESTEPRSGL